MIQQTCPTCSRPLGPPLSSGRQVCGGCGWASQPRASRSEGRSPSAPTPGQRSSASFPTPTHLLIYGVGVTLALVGALFLSKGNRLICERSLATQQGVCRLTEYNYLGQRRTLQTFSTSTLVNAYLREEHHHRTRRRGHTRRRESYSVYRLVLKTSSGDISTPFDGRNHQTMNAQVQKVQNFQGNATQPLLTLHEPGSPLIMSVLCMGGAIALIHTGLTRLTGNTPVQEPQ